MNFDQKLEVISQVVARARIYFDIWWVYEGAATKQAYLGTMNEYSEFFRFDSHAHFVSMVLYLGQLFETRHDTLNLASMVKEAEQSAETSHDEVVAAAGEFAAAKVLATKVTILRSNLFAHRSSSLSYADVFRKAEITPDQLRELTEAALAVINRLRRAVGKEDKSFHALSREDVVDVLETLKVAPKAVPPNHTLHRTPRLRVAPPRRR